MAFEMHLEDLIVLARRGQLTSEQERTLNEALSHQPELLTLYQAGLGFDEEDVLTPRDAEIAERIARQASSTPTIRRGRVKTRQHTLWLGVGLFFASAVSAAAVGGPLTRILSVFQAEKPVAEARSPGSERRTPLRRSAPDNQEEGATDDEVAAEEPTPPGLDPQPPAVRTTSAGSEQTRAAEVPTSHDESAASLYQKANQARREGRSEDALLHYMRLESHFPGSSQATAAILPAAELLYRAGRYEDALSRFRRYRGPLAPEALWGQARCLRAMGRSDEEQGILRQIGDQHPKSAYAPVATERLKGQSDTTPSR